MKKSTLIIAAADVVLAAALGAALIYSSGQIADVSMQGTADKWAGSGSDVPFTAVSYYTDSNSAIDIGTVYNIRTTAQQKITEQLGDNGNGFADCWYGLYNMSLGGPKGNVSLNCYAVGGSFFDIHESEVLSGSLFNEDSVNIDTVVLDENASWKLFGAVDTAGMTVSAGDKQFYISAVIKAPRDGELLKAYDDGDGVPFAYMPYQAVSEINQEETKFTGYDALMPDSIEKFGYDIIKEAAGYSDESLTSALIDSRSRFSIKNMLNASKKLEAQISSKSSVVYPYWEEAERGVYLKVSILYKAFFIPVCLLIASAVYWIFRLCGLAAAGIRAVFGIADKRSEHHKLINYYLKHGKTELAEEVMTDKEKTKYEEKLEAAASEHKENNAEGSADDKKDDELISR